MRVTWSLSGLPWPGDKVRTDPAPESGIIELEMGYGADEFGNVLSGAFTGEKSNYSCETLARHHWRIVGTEKEFQIEIEVSEKPPRKLGLFVLPVLRVQFNVLNSPADLQASFFDRFHKYFHKGGG
jgi:hypothetical protein